MKVCTKCGFEGEEALFRKDRNQCLACRNKYHKTYADARRKIKSCGECGASITDRRAHPGTKDGVYRCAVCQTERLRLANNAKMREYCRKKRAASLKPKYCAVCSDLIEGKRPGPSRKDGLFRCIACQEKRNREIMTKHMRDAFKGPKAEQYKATRNRCKAAWEQRNPEAAQARSLIKSVKRRLRQYEYDFERFIQPKTRELAKVLLALPDYCVQCNAQEDLTVEHIKPLVDFPELGFDPMNLTTLCRSCNTRSYHGNP